MSTALASLRDRHIAVSQALQQSRNRLAQVIPRSSGLEPVRAMAIALDALSRNPALLECEPRSIVTSVIQAAEVGLEIGGPLGEAFIVPFWNKKKQRKEASMMVGYKGYTRLMLGAPRVTAVKAVLVREKDVFMVDEGENKLTHQWTGNELARGEVTFVYARVWYGPNESHFEVIDRIGLDRIKSDVMSRLPAGMFSPYQDKATCAEMWRKAPIRKIAKSMDLSLLGRKAAETEALNEIERGEVAGVEVKENFATGRAEALKDMLREQREGNVSTLDAEFDEEPK